MEERTVERVYYVYVLYWYDMHPKAEIREDQNGDAYAVAIRENGEADPIVMPSMDKLKTIVKARTGKDEWTKINVHLWRLDNYWIKKCILGWDIDLDEMDYKENWVEISEDGKTRTIWEKKD